MPESMWATRPASYINLKILVSNHSNLTSVYPFSDHWSLIIFGQKGTGKSEIVKSLKHYYDENSIVNRC